MQLTNGARCLLIGANGAGLVLLLPFFPQPSPLPHNHTHTHTHTHTNPNPYFIVFLTQQINYSANFEWPTLDQGFIFIITIIIYYLNPTQIDLSIDYKTYQPDGAVTILGRSAFHDTRLNFERSYLDTDWGMRTVAFAGYGCPLQADIPVYGMMERLQAEYPERRDELLKLLGVDLQWRMHQVSDGQRRRVQIFLGLIRPFKILLLDEVTVSLDVVVRMDLLRWLKNESETRGATILYATHIFDGLDDWPTHLHYLCNKGHTGWQGLVGDLGLYQDLRKAGDPSPLLR